MLHRFLYVLITTHLLYPLQAALATPTQKNTVRIHGMFEIPSLDPTRSGYSFNRMQILETLINVDQSGQLTPGLASEWSVKNDGKIWELTLRDDVIFHDTTPLNSQIVVDNLNLIRTKPSALKKVEIQSIEAIDTHRIRITLTQPYRPLGAVLAHHSASIVAPSAINEAGEVTRLIGTGPFSTYEVAIPHKLIVKRFDQYWGQKASIEYASYLTGHRAEARVLQARSGQSDIVFGIDPAAIPMLKRLPGVSVIQSDLPRTLALKLNLEHPLLKDERVREALSVSINRKGIATAILKSPQAASDQLLPPSMKDWHLNQEGADYNLQRAKDLLRAVGWKKGAQNWFEKDGKIFALTLTTYADRPELPTIATAIQDQWKKLGIKLTVSITNSSAIPAGHQDGSLEVALMARNYGYIADPLGVLIKDFGQHSGGDWGSMNWSNPTIQTTLNNLIQEADAKQYFTQAQQITTAIYQEKPLIPIAYYVQQTVVGKRIEGFQFDPYERSYHLNSLRWKR
ncbi:MAG: ABC transporter substrate-binding protein [Cellvibrionaceae bacterium]